MSENSKRTQEDELSLEDFYQYLSRWQSAFPGGIPEEYIQATEATEATGGMSPEAGSSDRIHLSLGGTTPLRCVFFSSGAALSEQHTALLQAAIRKGLKWSVAECLLVDEQLSSDYSPLERDKRLLEGLPQAMILGEPSVALKNFLARKKGCFSRIIQTIDLRTVVDDPGTKRLFWNDLQQLLTSSTDN